MPEKDTQEQIVEVIPKTEADSGAQLPEHTILRFARFLLPKIQEDFETKTDKTPIADRRHSCIKSDFIHLLPEPSPDTMKPESVCSAAEKEE